MTAAKALVSEWNRMGSQMRFFVGTLAGIPDALMHYRGELLRVIAQMGLGTGVLAVIGGTVAIVGFLAMTTGAIVAVQGYNQFASVGVEALTVAGVVVAVPLFCVGLMTAYLAARVGTTAIYGQGSGVYDHYFNTFLRPTDVLWSSVEVVVVALMIMLVCTYYGYAAHGGPAGVGEAVGRAVRASMVVASIAILVMTLAIYGQSPNFHLAT